MAKIKYEKTLYRNETVFKIVLSNNNQVESVEQAETGENKTIRVFQDSSSAVSYCRELFLLKMKDGYKDWTAKKKQPGKSRIKLYRRKRPDSAPKEQRLEDIVVPEGYIEIDKDLADQIEKIASLLAEFMKQSKRTKAIKDIRDLMKSKKIYSSIQYKVNYALDQFEEKGILLAKWSLKKNNKVSRLYEPSNSGMVMIKATNLKIIICAVIEMIKILKGLLVYHDGRSPEQVKLMGRKGNGKILIRPKRLPTIRFFEEGKDLYYSSVKIIKTFQSFYPIIARRVMES